MKGLTGKRYFYRLGFRHGFQIGESLRPWARVGGPAWPTWAKEAYCAGSLRGKYQRQIARCVHEPLERRDRRDAPRCVHCGMRMRAKRRGAA